MEDWDHSIENILIQLSEEAQALSYFHLLGYRHYSQHSSYFQIPIILFTAVTGSANFLSTNFPKHSEDIVIIFGAVSIMISIISAIAQYFKLSELSEAHRISYLSWEKFFYNLKFELSKKIENRENVSEFYTYVKGEFQRLKEFSPILPTNIIAKGKAERKDLKDIHLPFFLNGFEKMKSYKESDPRITTTTTSNDNPTTSLEEDLSFLNNA